MLVEERRPSMFQAACDTVVIGEGAVDACERFASARTNYGRWRAKERLMMRKPVALVTLFAACEASARPEETPVGHVAGRIEFF